MLVYQVKFCNANNNTQELESYATNLEIENFKNNLHYIIKSIRLIDLGLLSGFLYTNANNAQDHLTKKLVSAIYCHKKKFINIDVNNLILSYKNTGSIILLNNYKNPDYVIKSFLPLSYFGIRKYISAINDPRKYKILLNNGENGHYYII